MPSSVGRLATARMLPFLGSSATSAAAPSTSDRASSAASWTSASSVVFRGSPGPPSFVSRVSIHLSIGIADDDRALGLALELLVERGLEARLTDLVVGVEFAVRLLNLLRRGRPNRPEDRASKVSGGCQGRVPAGELNTRHGAQFGLERVEVVFAGG